MVPSIRYNHGRSLSATASATAGWSKRSVRKVHFSLLVAGASGTGKSSFVNTLVGRNVVDPVEEPTGKFAIRPTTVELEEANGSRLVLTVIDTPGFGTQLDSADDIEQIATYIETKFDEVLAEESRIRRNPRFRDDRVDVCLYFIEPTGHGLREADVVALKRLGSIVNVIPVLARADTLTVVERLMNKRLVMEDVGQHHIKLFDFLAPFSDPEASAEQGEVDADRAAALAKALPFGITSSSEFDVEGKALFKRRLAYGVVDVLNPDHTDFGILRETLFDTHLTDLRESTRDLLYEAYRTARLDPRKTHRSSLLLPEELAEHAARLKEAQLQRDAQQLREEEHRIHAEIERKRQQLAQREKELRELELRMADARTQQQIQQQHLQQNPQIHSQAPVPGEVPPVPSVPSEHVHAQGPDVQPTGDALVAAQNQLKSEIETLEVKQAEVNANAAQTEAQAHAQVLAQAASSESIPSVPQRSPSRPLSYIQDQTSPLQIKKSSQ